MRYLFGGGYASDQGGKLGRAGFAMGMLDEGAGKLGALEFAAAEENLGARLSAGASLDGSSASLSALKENLTHRLRRSPTCRGRRALNRWRSTGSRRSGLAALARRRARRTPPRL